MCGTEAHRLLPCRRSSESFQPQFVHKFPENCGHALDYISMPVPDWTAAVVIPRCDPVTRPVQASDSLDRGSSIVETSRALGRTGS